MAVIDWLRPSRVLIRRRFLRFRSVVFRIIWPR
jgi:hypothetical protein